MNRPPAEHELRTSLACRACSAGWHGQPGDPCPTCHGRTVITGTILVIDLRGAP